MTDSGFRALMAAILARAVDDVRKGVQPIAAFNFLRGEYAGQMFQELGVDQRTAVDKVLPAVNAYRRKSREGGGVE
jgi:hypothetical protein